MVLGEEGHGLVWWVPRNSQWNPYGYVTALGIIVLVLWTLLITGSCGRYPDPQRDESGGVGRGHMWQYPEFLSTWVGP